MTLPTIQGIRNVFPHAYLEILLKPHLAPLFKRCTLIDDILFYPQGTGFELFKKETRLVQDLWSKQFDLAVILPRSVRSALIPFRARIPYRLGYSNLQRWVFLTHRLKETEEVLHCHQVDYYYAIARALGAADPREMPTLTTGKEEYAWAETFLTRERIGPDHCVIAVNPGSTYGSAKCWPAAKYRELARRLAKHPCVKIILIGGTDNASLVDDIAGSLDGGASMLVGEDLLRLAALLKKCHLLVTNDTGPMHLATAVGTPVVALFGSTDVKTTAPLGKGNRIIRETIECSPCLKRTCPENHLCMELITVDDVERVVMEKINISFKPGTGALQHVC